MSEHVTYFRPTELDTALDLAARPDAVLIAGGTDLYTTTTSSTLSRALVDVSAIEAISGIEKQEGAGTPQYRPGGEFRIGGATTWTELVEAELPPAFDGLKQAARTVGSVQIQNAGTIAGNLCNASPAADGVPPLLTLNAEVELTSAARGARRLALSDFITGVRATRRAPDEILTALFIPAPPDGARSAFGKLGARKYLVISIVMTAALVVLEGDGRISEARLAVGACSAVAQRLVDLEAALVGQSIDEITINPSLLSDLTPLTDVRGTAPFRLEVAAEQCRRTLESAVTGPVTGLDMASLSMVETGKADLS